MLRLEQRYERRLSFGLNEGGHVAGGVVWSAPQPNEFARQVVCDVPDPI
jgi:hypothetical protein